MKIWLLKYHNHIKLITVTLLLSLFTLLLGAVTLRVVKNSVNSTIFYLLIFLIAAILWFSNGSLAAIIFIAMGLVVILFSDLHIRNDFYRGLVSIIMTIIILSGVLLAANWAIQVDNNGVAPLLSLLNAKIDLLLSEFQRFKINSDVIDRNLLIAQLPSALVIILISALTLAVVFERRFAYLFNLPIKNNLVLYDFKVPDEFIWLLMLAILGSFTKMSLVMVEYVSLNVLNILATVYFLHGLAIVATYFNVYKISPLWQSLLYFIILLQLFIVVAILGILDLWFDFRKKILIIKIKK